MRFRFPVIIIDEDFRSENSSGLGIRALAKALEEEGLEVLGVTSYGDLSSFAQQQSRASAFILSVDDDDFSPQELESTIGELRTFVTERLVAYKCPESYEFVDGPVRDEAGKVRRSALAAQRAGNP